MPSSDAGPDVLADLLVLAAEEDAETLVETDRLLRDLVGAVLVHAAHRRWTERLRRGLAAAGREAADTDAAFDLVSRIRPSVPAGRYRAGR